MMKISRIIAGSSKLLLLAGLLGCSKADPKRVAATAASNLSQPASAKGETIARIHWLGMKRLASETNAAGFMKIWNLPETERLEKQTLDKLATAPWRLLLGQSVTNPASALLRPLLDDLVQEESYLEVSQATNAPAEAVFAVHLSEERAAPWSTNLAEVLTSLTGIKPEYRHPETPGTSSSWVLKKHDFPNLIQTLRTGEWMLVGVGQGTNRLLTSIANQIVQTHTPFATAPTNFWVELDCDVKRATSLIGLDWRPPTNTPTINISVIGDGQYVRTRGVLQFPQPLNLNLEPWNIPTNLIDRSISSFCAIRGIEPWLQSLKSWKDLQIGEPPNEIFFWALPDLLMQTYFAVPMRQASNSVQQLAELVMQKGSNYFALNDLVRFEKSTTFNGLQWKGVPFVAPFIKSVITPSGEFAVGGAFLQEEGGSVLPQEISKFVTERAGLVAYDWEISGLRSEQWTYLGQFLRMVLKRPQLAKESATLNWLRDVGSKLSASTSELLQTAPDQLVFGRKSEVGFTGIELQIMADWLESSRFPAGIQALNLESRH